MSLALVYLDHHAATPIEPRAANAMVEALEEGWANPSSLHRAGRAARRILERARERVAAALSVSAPDIVLTSGGTEAIHLAIHGVRSGFRRVIALDVDHPAVARSIDALKGVEVIRLPCNEGHLPEGAALDFLDEELGDDCLVALGWVNAETGSILELEGFAERCRRTGACLFVDGVQALGKLRIDLGALPVDLAAFASHKIGGPPGAGALYVRRGLDIEPVLRGGQQERGRRPGSPDPIAHAGFGVASDLLDERLEQMPRIGALRDRLEEALLARGAVRNGCFPRVATVVNVSIPGWRGSELVAALDLEGICASSGPACSSGLSTASTVIAALHPDEPWRAGSSLRLSLGPETSEQDIDSTLEVLNAVLSR